nr:MAG TPA: hypothetical protein [Caudoviricetes sp.]
MGYKNTPLIRRLEGYSTQSRKNIGEKQKYVTRNLGTTNHTTYKACLPVL